jgi:hypothetical protein
MLHRRIKLGLQLALLLGLAVELYEAQWMNATLVLAILIVSFLPRWLARGLELSVPPQMELLAIGFVFASVFLGETRDFYGRFWWWDVLLHATSGGLLGAFGFLLVYVLNETPRIELRMRPRFLALFAFCFAVTIGTAWEIFEYGVDRLFGTTMQKPTARDPSGLTDTMEDLIVDAIGAGVVVVLGYRSAKRGAESWTARVIDRFVAANPRLFPERSRRRQSGIGAAIRARRWMERE